MKTNLHTNALTLAAGPLLLLLLSTFSSQAQDAENEEAAAAALAGYLEFIKPGPEHKLMRSMVGDWKAKQTLWMAPGAPPVESDATATFRMAMGGRYLLQNYKSTMPGIGKFSGRGTTAFDKATGEYVSTWFDSMSTGIMVSKGKAVDDKTVSMVGEATDPMSKGVIRYRSVTKYVSKDRHEMEMYEQRPGAEERKMMSVVYTRVSKGGKKKE